MTVPARRGRPKKRRSSALGGKLLWAGLIVVILGGAVALAIDLVQPEAPPPPELEAVETFPDLGGQHLASGDPAPVYNSDPPTSGPHLPTPAPCGIYRQPVPDVAAVHSMEHGAIVVQYDPALPQDQIEDLEEIGRSIGGEIIVAPRPGNPAPVALTAWTKRLLIESVTSSPLGCPSCRLAGLSPDLMLGSE